MSNVELLHVYVLKNQFQFIKIGIAGNVAKRIKVIQANSGIPIIQHYESPSCVNAAQIEKTAHEHFAPHRQVGEWFDIPFDDAVDYVKSHFVDTAQQLALPVDQTTEINREFNGVKIRQRASDNYLDATAMCQANGKRWIDYFENKTTQSFLVALSKSENLALLELVQSERGRYGMTWIHPYVSINLAQWCSPEFAVLVSKWVFELMTKGHVSLNAQPALTPELETYIDARIRDGIINALAKPVKPQPLPPMHQTKTDNWHDLITDYTEHRHKLNIFHFDDRRNLFEIVQDFSYRRNEKCSVYEGV